MDDAGWAAEGGVSGGRKRPLLRALQPEWDETWEESWAAPAGGRRGGLRRGLGQFASERRIGRAWIGVIRIS